jgi:hypothetical protein
MFQLAPVLISTHWCQLYGSYIAEKTRVFLRLVAKTHDRFLEQQINITFFILYQKLSLGMRHGVFNMISKAKDTVCNGNSRSPRHSKSQIKTMLITFFDIKCIAHFEFLPQGQTVTWVYYVEILKQLREAVRKERPELWPNDWFLHRDNAAAHKTPSVKQFWPKNGLLKWNTYPVPLNGLRMTFGCFQT